MASDRKPSIYSDRGTIGSPDELDEYGVWVKSEPQDLSSANTEGQGSVEPLIPAIEELPDFDTGFGGEGDFSGSGDGASTAHSGEDNFTFDDEPLGIPDLDLPEEPAPVDEDGAEPLDLEDFSIPEESPETSSDGEGFTEVSMEDFLGATSDNFEESGLALADGDDSVDTASPAEEKNTATADLSTQLLIKIADELSSIRTELSTLKREFSAIREESSADDKGDAQKKGFFDEEEDEKISLTGDELDNILNTADFTEEAGADATEELTPDFPSMEAEEDTSSDPFQVIEDPPLPDTLSDQEDIIGGEPDEGPEEKKTENDIDIELSLDQPDLDELEGDSIVQEQAAPAPGISLDPVEFDIDLETTPLVDETAAEDFGILETPEDSEELRQLREEGALPMTPVPEDTSYLDVESLEMDSGETLEELSLDDVSLDEAVLDEDSLDLSEAVIDEPDLSGKITENPPEEPALDDITLEDIPEDISIDLDMEDLPAADSSENDAAEELLLPEALEPEEELELSIPGEQVTETDDTPAEETAGGEEESFAQVIPEGFVVEADDSAAPFDDDPEEVDILSEGDIDPLDKSQETAGEADAAVQGEGGEFSEDGELDIPSNIKQELKTVLSYMDQLLESLPEDKIEEFAKSEYFDTYKKLFKELGLV
jgi:hypothetical protein